MQSNTDDDRREYSPQSLGRITELSANKEIEIQSVSFSSNKNNSGGKQQAKVKPSPQLKNGNTQKDKEVKFYPSSTPSSKKVGRATAAYASPIKSFSAQKQMDSSSKLSQSSRPKQRPSAVSKGISPLKSSPIKSHKKNEAFLRTKAFAKQINTRKIVDNGSSARAGQGISSLLTASSGRGVKNTVQVYSSQTLASAKYPTNSSGNDSGRTPRVIEQRPQPAQYPTLIAEQESKDAYYVSPKASPKSIGKLVPQDDKTPQSHRSPGRKDLARPPSSGSSKSVFRLSDLRQSGQLPNNSIPSARGSRTQNAKRLLTGHENSASLQNQISLSNGNLSGDSRAELLMLENFQLKKELYDLKKQLYMNNSDNETEEQDISEIHLIASKDKDSECQSHRKRDSNRFKSPFQPLSDERRSQKPILRDTQSIMGLQQNKTPSPIGILSSGHRRQITFTSAKKSVCGTSQQKSHRAMTLMSDQCKEACCQNDKLAFKPLNSQRFSGMQSFLSDDSMPSMDVAQSARSRAPVNQLRKLNQQKDIIKPNSVQTVKPSGAKPTKELKKPLNNYSYDQRLKNLQQSLNSANKYDQGIRKELENDDLTEYSDEQNLDELEPQIDYINNKKKPQRDRVDRLHYSKFGPNTKRSGGKKEMYVLSLRKKTNEEESNDFYSVNDVSVISNNNDGGSVRFSTQRKSLLEQSASQKLQLKESNSSILMSGSKDNRQIMFKLEDNTKLKSERHPQSPTFAERSSLGPLPSERIENDVYGLKAQKQSQHIVSQNLLFNPRRSFCESPTEPTPDMPDEIEYQYYPNTVDPLADIEQQLQKQLEDISKSQIAYQSNSRSKNTQLEDLRNSEMFHSRKSSRNHYLDEFTQENDGDESSDKQIIRVTPKGNFDKVNPGRVSQSMRQLKTTGNKHTNKAKPPSGSLLKNRTIDYNSGTYTETMQSVPNEAYPYQGSDPGQTPTKLSENSNLNQYAHSVQSKQGFTNTMQRMTSADKVKVSTPMSYKTKQSLDTSSMKTLNSQKSTRRMQPSVSVEGGSSRQSQISFSAATSTVTAGNAPTSVPKSQQHAKNFKILAQKPKAGSKPGGKSLGWRYLSSVIKK